MHYSIIDYEPEVILHIQPICLHMQEQSFFMRSCFKSLVASCGVSLVYGDVNREKSKSVELTLTVWGLRQARYSSISDAFRCHAMVF